MMFLCYLLQLIQTWQQEKIIQKSVDRQVETRLFFKRQIDILRRTVCCRIHSKENNSFYILGGNVVTKPVLDTCKLLWSIKSSAIYKTRIQWTQATCGNLKSNVSSLELTIHFLSYSGHISSAQQIGVVSGSHNGPAIQNIHHHRTFQWMVLGQNETEANTGVLSE